MLIKSSHVIFDYSGLTLKIVEGEGQNPKVIGVQMRQMREITEDLLDRDKLLFHIQIAIFQSMQYEFKSTRIRDDW